MTVLRLTCVLVATGAGLISALPATAQTAANPTAGSPTVDSGSAIATDASLPPGPSAQTSESNATKLDEIVVTATKRKQVARDIPSTVNVLTGAALEKQGAHELSDFADQVPGLQIEDTATTSSRKIVIRGIGPDDTTNQTVGVLLGDVPLGDPFGGYTVIDPDPWDLKDVEVLKGPQGTLFGASSLAGIIRYVPNDPALGEWSGKAFSEWTDIKEGGFEPTFAGALNVPLGSTFAVRGSGVLEHSPGFIDVDTPGRDVSNADDTHKWEGRFMARWEPVKRLSFNASFMEQQAHKDETSFVDNFNGTLSKNDAPTPSPSHRAFSLANLDARYAFDWATLVSLTAFQHKVNQFNLDVTYSLEESAAQDGVSLGRASRDVDANGVVQEFRLVSNDKGPWTWQGGAFYSAYSAYITSDIYLSNTSVAVPVLGMLPSNIGKILASQNGLSVGNATFDPAKAGEEALFGELTRTLGPLSVTLGGRLYRTEVDGLSTVAGGSTSVTHLLSDTSDSEYLDVKGHGFSPKAALTLRAARDVLLYASASRGFQYGGVNVVAIEVPGDVVPATYRSSTLWSYETGIRADWFHNTLRTDVTGFYQQWDNAQISQASNSGLDVYVDNVGQVISRGIEWSFRYKLPFLTGLSIETSGNYLESKTATEFTNSAGVVTPSGTDMPSAPHIQGSGTLAYSHQFGGKWNTQGALIYTHVNTSWNDIEHDHELDARDLFNLNFSLARPDLVVAPAISVVLNNITDQKRITSVAEVAETAEVTATEGIPVTYTKPRTLILRFTLSF